MKTDAQEFEDKVSAAKRKEEVLSDVSKKTGISMVDLDKLLAELNTKGNIIAENNLEKTGKSFAEIRIESKTTESQMRR